MTDYVQVLREKQEITELLIRMFVGTDNRDWAEVESCFAPSVLFDMTSMSGGKPSKLTPGEIISQWDNGLQPLKAIHHQVGNLLIRTNTESAVAFCYGTASHYLPNKSGNNTRTFVGSYEFHLIRNNNRWLIDRFKFNLKYIEGNQDLETEDI